MMTKRGVRKEPDRGNVTGHATEERIAGGEMRNSVDTTPIRADSFDVMVRSFIEQSVGKNRRGTIVLQYNIAPTRRSPTYAGLGGNYGVSRQRIHQVIVKGDQLMSRPEALGLLSDFWAAVTDVLKAQGGLISIDRLTERLAVRYKWAVAPNRWILGRILPLNPAFRVGENVNFVYLSDFACAECPRAVRELQALLEQGDYELTYEEAARGLAERCRRACPRHLAVPKVFGTDFIEWLVAHSRRALVLDGSKVFTREYASVKIGKNLRDALWIALRKLGYPMHYQKLTEVVRKNYPAFADVSDDLVIRRLRNRRFVRVRRAVYGLAAWKFPSYQARINAIAEIILKNGGQATEQAVLAAFAGNAEYKPHDLVATLHDQHQFTRAAPGTYRLRAKTVRKKI